MKKNIFLAMAAVVVMFFTGCSKDIDLVGTKWQATYNSTVNIEGVEATMNMNLTLNFVDATKYTLTYNGTAQAMGMSMPIPEETEEGTYTFDGENGMFDQEQAFTYNKKDKTIVMTMQDDDPEFTEMMGTNSVTLTFTQVK